VDLPGRLIVIVSSSSLFVNGLDQAQSAAFSGRSSGVFIWTEKSDRRKSSKSRFLEIPTTWASPEIRVVTELSVIPVTRPPASMRPGLRNTPRPASRN
jgi:hypothetical protein